MLSGDERRLGGTVYRDVDSSWNVMAHGDAREEKWRGHWRMGWVASTLHTTSEHGVSSITTADAHTSAASSRLNWHPRRKTKSGFCACAITFQPDSAYNKTALSAYNIILCRVRVTNCCRGKEVLNTPSVSVVLVIQHAKRMCCIILSFVACLALAYFTTLSHKR